jgi:hypothetical protein
VVVVGGGSAGAAQAGARTLLLEAAGCVAGAAALKCVQTYCGLYTITGPVRPAAAGVAAQVIAELRRLGGVEGPVKFRGVFMLLDSEAVKYALDTVCENAGAEVLLHAQLMRADRDDALARSVTCHDHTVTAAAFVDATGECDLAWFAGASTRYGNHCFVNLGTLGTRFGGIAPDADLSEETWHAAIHAATIGRMVLDRNPENHFAEVEQSGFDPSNLVPGTGLSPDKMLMGRIFSCHDTHLHRIGPNYEQLPVNAPGSPVHSYNKDCPMAYRHAGSQPVYAPNS